MPARVDHSTNSENRTIFDLGSFVSKNGFLPAHQPLKCLQDIYYEPWEQIIDKLPTLIRENAIRHTIDILQVLTTSRLTSEDEWQRAYVVLSFLAHGYIWGGDVPSQVLPPSITVPYLQVSKHLDLPPVATYAALNLWNFSCLGEDFTDLDSLRALHTFSGTEDESWFFALSVAVEARGAYIIPLIMQAMDAVNHHDRATVTSALSEMAYCIKQLTRLLDRMIEKCDPTVFYNQIRPFLAGTKNMAPAGLPNGVFYDEGDGVGRWMQLRGGSNGQSSLIQFLDLVLGVDHASTGSGLQRGPTPHRKFLANVSRMSRIKELVFSNQISPGWEPLYQSYQDAIKALGEFRTAHIQIVTRYIVVPSKKPAPSSVMNLATAFSRPNRGATMELAGTGGTELIPFLRMTRDETYRAGLLVSSGDVSSSPSTTPPNLTHAATPVLTAPVVATPSEILPNFTRHSDVSVEEEAEVPRDARLICDTQGKLVFIGDCAPLSLFQTIRQIITSRVDPHAFTPETSRVSMLENISSEELVLLGPKEPAVNSSNVRRLVVTFLSVTCALVDLFDTDGLVNDVLAWVNQAERSPDAASAVYYLVLAIGSQSDDEQAATTYFLHGKSLALSGLAVNLSIGTVQSFLLITLYMLRSCQINGAFLFFGIAARAAYAIGLHRTEVNFRFGPEIHTRRDRLWKSVRVLDLYLSISMGRPPAAADADCTVPYHCTDEEGNERYDLLNASVQILSIVEGIILKVYSRRKISLQSTEGISRQLREWSKKWLSPLLRELQSGQASRESTGACHVLSSYYYAVMLVSRPFLMYELCRRLSASSTTPQRSVTNSTSGRSKLANACIDAATLMLGMISDLVEQGPLDGRMPLIVSWLFASSLVVGVGLLGGFGRALEKQARMSVAALEHFAKHDAHASQYARIAESLRLCALGYLEKRDAEDRRRIAEESTQLFGLVPQSHRASRVQTRNHSSEILMSNLRGNISGPESSQPWESEPFDDFDPSIFSFSDAHVSQADFQPAHSNMHDTADQVFGAVNLFPLLDGNGHIDLAHLL
ncbi:IDO-domain-containing protein [Xylariaceae sp. FL1651]|nr:IDO-domain-containing protein [Xylariaceae sp. FL1651]